MLGAVDWVYHLFSVVKIVTGRLVIIRASLSDRIVSVGCGGAVVAAAIVGEGVGLVGL